MLRILRFLKKVWLQIALTVVFLVCQVVCTLFIPDQMKNISTYIQNQEMNMIWKMGGTMLFYVLGSTVSAVLVSYFSSAVGTIFARELRKDIFKKVSSISLTEFDAIGVSSLITRTTNDVTQIQQAILMGLRIIIQAPLTLIIAIIMITVQFDPTTIWVLCISAPLLVILILVILFKALPLIKSMQKKIDRTTLVLRENLTGVRVIRAFDKQQKESIKFNEANKDLTFVNIKANRYFGLLSPAITFIMNITYLGVFFIGFLSFNGDSFEAFIISFSQVMAVAQYVMQIMMAFMMFAMIFVFLPRASVSASRINVVLDLPIPYENFEISPKVLEQLNKKHGYLEFENVSFKFQDSEVNTIENISFKCEPNKTTAIIGSTGSGKSTIINLIPRFYDATEGKVMFNGVDLKQIPGYEIRNRISFVPQKNLLFKGTIKENMLFGNPNATSEDIENALAVSQSTYFVNNKPQGIDSEVAQGGTNFSGGQRQRLCIARALCKKSEVYVFDDSFSALDFKTDVKVRTALKSYIQDAAVIIVGQRVSSIMDADNIIVLDEGKIVGQGTHSELIKSNKVYQEIVKSQLDPDEVESTIKLSSSLKEAA